MECVRLRSRMNEVETTDPYTNARKAAARARCDRNNKRRTCTNETFLFCTSILSVGLLSFASNAISLSVFSVVLDRSLLALLLSMIRNRKAKSKTATMMPKMKGPRKPKRVYSPPPTGGPTSALERNYDPVRGNKPCDTYPRETPDIAMPSCPRTSVRYERGKCILSTSNKFWRCFVASTRWYISHTNIICD